ncbi:hypothetical protein [Iamia sp.]|nr:hypothetical protein [Iamia sp.]HXH59510.1 hypothetical protein [Iamia sp.]
MRATEGLDEQSAGVEAPVDGDDGEAEVIMRSRASGGVSPRQNRYTGRVL